MTNDTGLIRSHPRFEKAEAAQKDDVIILDHSDGNAGQGVRLGQEIFNGLLVGA